MHDRHCGQEGQQGRDDLFRCPSHKKDHSKICSEPKQGSVTGTVTDDGKKKTVAVKSLKFD